MNNSPYFSGDTWVHKALMDFVAFQELADFAACEPAIQVYATSLKVYSTDISVFSESQIESLRNNRKVIIKEASEKLGCQTIISLCTTLEVANREFLKCYFFKNPAALFAYIGPDHAKGHIALKQVLNTKSHAELIEGLAGEAANLASKGKYGQVLNRIRKLCGLLEDTQLSQDLDLLQSKRNKIVHDKLELGREFANVNDAHSTIHKALENICEIGLAKGIPGEYSYIQPIHLESHNIDFAVI